MYYNPNTKEIKSLYQITQNKNVSVPNKIEKIFDFFKLYDSEQTTDFDPTLYTLNEGEIQYIDGKYTRVFSVVELPMESAKLNLKNKITEKRKSIEENGLTISDVEFKTSALDIARLLTTIEGMKKANIESTDYKTKSGWIVASLPDLETYLATITTFVEKLFSHEQELHEMVDNCTSVSELKAIDIESGWV